MRKQVERISVHQTSKVLAFLHLVVAAIFLIPLGLAVIFNTGVLEGVVLMLYPLVYAIFAYMIIAILSLIYNWIAGYFGGIEITVKEMEKIHPEHTEHTYSADNTK